MSHGEHKAKTYSRVTKDKEKGIKAYIPLEKIIKSQRKAARKEARNKITTRQPERVRGTNKPLLINT